LIPTAIRVTCASGSSATVPSSRARFTVDVSYVDREYRDRPAEYDTNQVYNSSGETLRAGWSTG
jgi:hypothetical protein